MTSLPLLSQALLCSCGLAWSPASRGLSTDEGADDDKQAAPRREGTAPTAPGKVLAFLHFLVLVLLLRREEDRSCLNIQEVLCQQTDAAEWGLVLGSTILPELGTY